MIAVQRRNLHQHALGEQGGLNVAQDSDDRFLAKGQDHRRVGNRAVGLLQATRLVAQLVIDDGQLLLGNGNFVGHFHGSGAHAHMQKIRMRRHAIPEPVRLIGGQRGTLGRVGIVLRQPVILPGDVLLQLGLHLLDVLLIQLPAAIFGDSLLLFAIAPVGQTPHHRQKGGGGDHDQAGRNQMTAAAGNHGAHEHRQHHRHGGAQLQNQRSLRLSLLRNRRLDLHVLQLTLCKHARRALVFDADVGLQLVLHARGRRLRLPLLKANLPDARHAVDRNVRSEAYNFHSGSEGKNISVSQPHGMHSIAAHLSTVEIGSVHGVIPILNAVVLVHGQRAVLRADDGAGVADVRLLTAADEQPAPLHDVLVEAEPVPVPLLDDHGQHPVRPAVADIQHDIRADLALAVPVAVLPDQRPVRHHVHVAVEHSYGDAHIVLPARFFLTQNNFHIPVLVIGKEHILAGITE